MPVDWVKWRKVGEGLATYVPGVNRLAQRVSGGSGSARYCYSIWLRHLRVLADAGLSTSPKALAELGPGDSLGIGLTAMLTGVDRYFACDVRVYADTARNLAVLDELTGLLRERAAIPGPDEFPRANPRLERYDFPHDVLTDERMAVALDESRLAAIRRALRGEGAASDGVSIRYVAPWYDRSLVPPGTLDMVLSQAVLEHVDDLEAAYATMRSWLRPGGVMSHQVDFYCHHYAQEWNGHWTYSPRLWRVIRGRRTYAINRQPLSRHRALLAANGFRVCHEHRNAADSSLPRAALAAEFRHLTNEDLTTRSALLQAIKLDTADGGDAADTGGCGET